LLLIWSSNMSTPNLLYAPVILAALQGKGCCYCRIGVN
jgi:hypothetical protein